MSFFKYLQIVLLFPTKIFCLSELQMEELQWTMYNDNRSISVSTKVPGGVYGTLMDQEILEEGDFYFRYNDLNYRSVSYQNWNFETQFQASEDLLNESRIILQLDGIDTMSFLFLDDVPLGTTDNMFRQYSFDVKHLLKPNFTHNLSIHIESPVTWSKSAYEEQLKDYEVPPKCVDPAFRGECHANFIRKMQASFGWDWGPAFPNMGIWKPLRIIGWNSVVLKNIAFQAEPQSSFDVCNKTCKWEAAIRIFFDTVEEDLPITGSITIYLDGIIYVDKYVTVIHPEVENGIRETFTIPEDTVATWWPNGYGDQPLYNLTAIWTSEDQMETSSKSVRVGFRVIELDQSYLNEDLKDLGRHYRFLVNGVSIFLKGSNWIPAHVLPERVTPEYTKQLLQDAAKTHQNCIRVWGGGVYESDQLYETADELGIMIWQDFMFACSMYPASRTFLANVIYEVQHQMKRLQHHSSILVWAGNNENEAALRGNWYATMGNFTLYQSDYIKLYVDIIRPTIQEFDTSRPIIISSPSNGIESENESYIAQNPYDNRYGDVHYYNYIKDSWDWRIYPRTRLASEYGYQSWPSFATLQEATNASDWFVDSPIMSHRQHHPFGNLQLEWMLMSHFKVKKMFLPKLNSFKMYLYLTQIEQAESVRIETEFYRRGLNRVDDKGLGYTSGALYWQLNDIWQGASWASIEFGGRWKMLHYFAAKFFAPILLSPQLKSDTVELYLINDSIQNATDLEVEVHIRNVLSINFITNWKIKVESVRSSSEIIATLDIEKDLGFSSYCDAPGLKPKNICFLTYKLKSNDKEIKIEPYEGYLFLTEPKYFNLKKAKILIKSIVANDNDPDTFLINLQTNVLSLFVWLETNVKGIFSDNGFHMYTNVGHVQFIARENTTADVLLKSIKVTSLSDTFLDKELIDHSYEYFAFKNKKNHINRIFG